MGQRVLFHTGRYREFLSPYVDSECSMADDTPVKTQHALPVA